MTQRCGASAGKLVFAHRGASGYLPEHTLGAYALAAGMGAHVLEPDVVLTRDHVAICLHDVHLDRVTDVESIFRGRARPDGRYYALDFDFDEVRQLTATGGDRHALIGARIPALEEMFALTKHLELRLGREIGVAPELKAPEFHNSENAPIESVVAALLSKFNIDGEDANCYLQCFDAETLVRLRRDFGYAGPLVQLVGDEPLSDAELDAIRTRADVLSPPKAAIDRSSGELVARAHERGLKVVPYTFKDDEEETSRFFRRYDVDGVFSDFPDVALRALYATDAPR